MKKKKKEFEREAIKLLLVIKVLMDFIKKEEGDGGVVVVGW